MNIAPDRLAELTRSAEQARTQLVDLDATPGGMGYRAGYLAAMVHHLLDVIEQLGDDDTIARLTPVGHSQPPYSG